MDGELAAKPDLHSRAIQHGVFCVLSSTVFPQPIDSPIERQPSMSTGSLQQDLAPAGKKSAFRLGAFGSGLVVLDLVICAVNAYAVYWMYQKCYVEKQIDYVELETFVKSAMAAAGLVALFGILGNLLMLTGVRFGARLASYRVGMGIGSIGVALFVMFFLVPKPDRIMSEDNFDTYLRFGGVSAAYFVWMLIYWLVARSAAKAST